jgi:hypothetical protein
MRATVGILLATLVLSPASARSEDEATALKQENEKLKDELKKAQAKIASLEAQMKQLRQKLAEKSQTKTQHAQSDPFSVGTTFSGSRFYRQKGANQTDEQLWTLTVTEREKGRFKGLIEFKSLDGRKQKIDVSGTAPPNGKGTIRFKTVSGGTFNQEFNGATTDGRRLALKFKGTGIRGDQVFGDGNLERN